MNFSSAKTMSICQRYRNAEDLTWNEFAFEVGLDCSFGETEGLVAWAKGWLSGQDVPTLRSLRAMKLFYDGWRNDLASELERALYSGENGG